MPKGISIHIGLNSVDPGHYEGWDGALAACEADAKDMYALARSRASRPSPPILTKKATASAVAAPSPTRRRSSRRAISCSSLLGPRRPGEGPQRRRRRTAWTRPGCSTTASSSTTRSTRSGGSSSPASASSCCPTAATAARSTRTYLRSSTGARAAARCHALVGEKVEKAHRALYRSIQDKNKSAEKTKVAASALLISGCMDNQFSMDGDRNGAFTGTLEAGLERRQVQGPLPEVPRQDRVADARSLRLPTTTSSGAPDLKFKARSRFRSEGRSGSTSRVITGSPQLAKRRSGQLQTRTNSSVEYVPIRSLDQDRLLPPPLNQTGQPYPLPQPSHRAELSTAIPARSPIGTRSRMARISARRSPVKLAPRLKTSESNADCASAGRFSDARENLPE